MSELPVSHGCWPFEEPASFTNAREAFERMRRDQIAKREAEQRRAFASTADVPVPRWRA